MGVLGNKKLAPGGASAVRHSNRKVCEREREGEAGRKVGGGRMRRGMDGRVASDWRGPWRVCACLRLFAIACVVLCARDGWVGWLRRDGWFAKVDNVFLRLGGFAKVDNRFVYEKWLQGGSIGL